MLLRQPRQQLNVRTDQLAVYIQFNVFALVIHSYEDIEAPALECARQSLADHVLEILVLSGNLRVNVEIPMIHTLDFDQDGQVRRLGAAGPEPGHAIDHVVTS